jgi:hypothetical protein
VLTRCLFSIYYSDTAFSEWAYEGFHGDQDEGDTLKAMLNQINPKLFNDPSIVRSIENTDDQKRQLMNLASAIAMEETFTVNVKMDTGTGKERVHQGVLFMKKFQGFGDGDSDD